MYDIDSLSTTTCSDTNLSNGIVKDTEYNNEVLIELNRFYNITRYKVEALIKNKSLNSLITKYDLIDPNGLKEILALHKLDIHQEKILKIALILSRAINNRNKHNEVNDNEGNVEDIYDRHYESNTDIHYNIHNHKNTLTSIHSPYHVDNSTPDVQSNSLGPADSSPLEVQSNSSPLTSTVGLADSSSNYLSLKSRATPGDRGREGSDGMKSSTRPLVDTSSGIPVADLWEAKGQLNRKAPCNGKVSRIGHSVDTSSIIPGIKVYAISSSKSTRKNIKILPGRTSEFYLEEQISTNNITTTSIPHDDQSYPFHSPPPEVTSTVGLADSSPLEVTTSSSTRRGASSNSLPVNGIATPVDRGREGTDGSSIIGMMEDGAKDVLDVTSSGGPQVEPENDLWEFEGEVIKRAVCKTKRGEGTDCTSGGSCLQDEEICNIDCISSLDIYYIDEDISLEFINSIINDDELFNGIDPIIMNLLFNICIWLVETRYNLNIINLSYELMIKLLYNNIMNKEILLYLKYIINDINIINYINNNQFIYWRLRLIQISLYKLKLNNKDINNITIWLNNIINNNKLNIYIYDELICIICQIWLITNILINIPYKYKLIVIIKLLNINEYNILNNINIYELIYKLLYSNIEIRKLILKIIELSIYKLNYKFIYKFINRIINRKNFYKFIDLNILKYGNLIYKNKFKYKYKYKLYKLLFNNLCNYNFILYYINNFFITHHNINFIKFNSIKISLNNNYFIIKDILSTIIILHLYNNTFDIISFHIFIFLSILSININYYINYYINFINLNNDNIINNIIKLWIIINTIKYPCIYFDRFINILIKFTINIIHYLIYQHDYNNIIIILKSTLHTLQITNASNHYSFIPYAIDLITKIFTHYNLLVCNTIQKYFNKIIKKILINNVQSLIHNGNCYTNEVTTTLSSTRRGGSPLEVQSNSSSTRRGGSPNYSSLKSIATPRDRGGGEGSDEGMDGSSIMGMMEDGAKDVSDVTSSGIPGSDLRELEGEVNRRGCLQDEGKVGDEGGCRRGEVSDVTSSGENGVIGNSGDKKPHNDNKPHYLLGIQIDDEYMTSSGLPVADLREAEGQLNKGGCLQDEDKVVTSSGEGRSVTSGNVIKGGMDILSNLMRYRMRGMRELILNDFTPYISLSLTRCFCEMSKHVSISGYMLELFLLLFNDVSSTNYIITGLYYNILFNFGFNLCRVLTRFFLYIQSQNWDSNTFTNIRRVMRLFLFKKNKINTKLTKKRNTNGFVLSKLHMPYTRINKGKVYISNKNITNCSFNDYLQHLLDKEFVHIKGNCDTPILSKDYSLDNNAKKLKHHDCPGE